MKRLVVRICILAILVVLGLIAIAQAQRSVDRSPESTKVNTSEAQPASPPALAPVTQPSHLQPVADSRELSRARPPAREIFNPFALATAPQQVELPAYDRRPAPATEKSLIIPTAATLPVATESTQAPRLDSPTGRDTSLVEGGSLAAVPQKVREESIRDVSKDRAMEAQAAATVPPPSVLGNRYVNASAPANAAASRYPSMPSQVSDKVPLEGAASRDSIVRESPAPMRLDPTLPSSELPGMAGPNRLNSSDARSVTGVAATDAIEGNGQPGKKQLEGPQAPHLTIQKYAPEGVQVHKAATFRVTVVNAGQTAAHGVEIRDMVPKGCQLISTKPRASRGAGGELVWEVGTMKPGDEISVEMQIMPTAEGELGSVATVRFNAEASAKTIVTRPELVVTATVPKVVMINDSVTLNITVNNPGTGVATGVVLHERVPAGLQFAAGTDPKCEIGTLKPGETQRLQLTLTAVRAGTVTNVLSAEGDGALKAEDRTQLEIVAPKLEIGMEGPKRRYLEREATYVLSVSNPGTASAKQVQLVAYLPHGLKFVSANNFGHYEAATQTVHWTMDELPARDSDKVELVTLPIEAGDHKLRLEGRADKGLAAEKEQPIRVEGIAAVLFEVTSVNNPIEVGGETVYEIRVVNQGSKAASNVRIVTILPPGMRAVAAEGPTRHVADAGRVQFESLARLAPKADTTYRVRVQGLQPGDLRVRVQMQTDEMQEPVTKEECTRVYKDE